MLRPARTTATSKTDKAAATPRGGKATERLDLTMVRRGLAESRERAQALILAGIVSVAGRVADRASQAIPSEIPIEVAGPEHPYVGRGGLKLQAALDAFGIDTAGMVALDVGASTGGFTDCLLQRGAAR